MKAIILAAGAGTRMKTGLPKVLHTLAGKPMLHYVIEACVAAGIEDIVVVVGVGGKEVVASCEGKGYSLNFVWQDQQLGTGHAVLCAREHIGVDERVVVLFGDSPLIAAGFLRDLGNFQEERGAAGVIVAARVPDPFGYGRVITDERGEYLAIVEQKDLGPEQQDIDFVNTSLFMATGREFLFALEALKNDNRAGEYYLTDVPGIMKAAGHRVAVYHDENQFLGINSQKQLAEAAAAMRERIIERHFENGVAIIDPGSVYIDDDVEIAPGVTLHPGVILQGNTKIGAGTVIAAYSHVTDCQIGEGCRVGPFVNLRAGTVVGDACRIGNFVETKNAVLGDDTKASHLAYIGDAEIGRGVNFGCGAITVNYNGRDKFRTVVEDEAFIGSNVNLIAPLRVHKGACVAAGSTIAEDVPADALAISRVRELTIKEGQGRKFRRLKK